MLGDICAQLLGCLSPIQCALCQRSNYTPKLTPNYVGKPFAKIRVWLTSMVWPLANFTFSLYRQSTQLADENQNVIISPFSVSFALAMTYAGAEGNTKAQLKKLLLSDSDLSDQEFHSLFSQIMQIINKSDAPYKLGMANRLYAEKSFVDQILPTFTDCLSKFYDSQLHAKDMARDGERTRLEINQWVSKVTNDKIKDLLAPDALSNARLILINAIYFKGNWDNQFDPEQTTKRPFYAADNKEMSLDTMQKFGKKYRYVENEMCQVLGLAYTGKDLFMYVFLPKEKYGLAALENHLTGSAALKLIQATGEDQIMQNCAHLVKGYSEVALPKFKSNQSLQLKEALQNMGAGDMFGEADFSAINGAKNLFVSKVIHQAFIEVNEEGTEAAAATAVVMVKGCAMMRFPEIQFIADHPFLYCIFDQRSKSFLFVGRFCG